MNVSRKLTTWIIGTTALAAGALAYANLIVAGERGMMDVATRVADLPQRHRDVASSGLAFSPDHVELAAAAETGNIDIWDWRTGRIRQTLTMPQGAVNINETNPVSYSPDGRFLAVCFSKVSDLVVRVWNVGASQTVHDIADQGSGSCAAILFSPDGKLLLRANNRIDTASDLTAIEIDTWTAAWTLKLPGNPISIAASPGGSKLVVGETVLDTAGLKAGERSFSLRYQPTLSIVNLHNHSITRNISADTMGPVAWTADGQRIGIAGQDGVEIVDSELAEKVGYEKAQPGHKNIRFTPDGRFLIESDMNGQGTGQGVKIWDASRQTLFQRIPGNPSSMAISGDGRYLAIGDVGHTAVWQLK